MVLGDCNRGYGIPAYPACSGNGVCVLETNKCLCNKDWSSLADFQVKHGIDCDIHLPTMLGLACSSLVVSSIGAILCLFALCCTGLKKTKGSYTKITKLIAFLICFIGMVLVACLKIHDLEKNVVGSSLISSSGIFIMLTNLGIGFSYYLDEVVAFLRKSCRFIADDPNNIFAFPLESKLLVFRRFRRIPPLIAFSTTAFLVIAHADPLRADLYSIGFMGVLLAMILVYVMLILSALPVFLEEMDKLLSARPNAPESTKIRQIHFYLSIVRKSLIVFTLTIGPMHVVFMSWTYLRRKYSYLMWVTFIFSHINTVLVCITFIKINRVSPVTALL